MQPNDGQRTDGREAAGRRGSGRMKRRAFVTSVGAGAALLAGCTSGGDGGSGGGSDGSDGGDGTSGTDTGGDATGETSDGGVAGGRFRLLISDRPAAIGDFDSLTVSFSHARVFGDIRTATEDETATADGTATATATSSSNETGGGAVQPESDEDEDDPGNGNGRGNGGDDGEEEEAEGDDGDDGQGGFTRFDLAGASVDLTQVVGDRAMPVLDETLAPGRYTKIELHASDVTGIVDGEEANVHIPSGKLMLTQPFEVAAGETVSFVFDINVVQRGQGNDYNLLPVIGESGVAGEDVDVEEVENGEDGEGGATESATATDAGTATGTATETASDD